MLRVVATVFIRNSCSTFLIFLTKQEWTFVHVYNSYNNFFKKQKMKGYEFAILFSECRLWLTYVYSPVDFL